MNNANNIIDYLKARYPILAIETPEEERVLEFVKGIADELGHEMYVWNCADGLMYNDTPLGSKTADFRAAIDMCDSKARESGHKCLFVFCDAQTFLSDTPNNALYRRKLKSLAINIRNRYQSNCILVSTHFDLSPDLQKEVTFVDFPLPTREDIKKQITEFVDRYRDVESVVIDVDDNLIERFVNASIGLTSVEIENCFSKALVSDRRLDADDLKDLINEKKQIVRKSGILEFVDTNLNLNDVGGLATLKRWLELRSHCFDEQAKLFGIKSPKGVLLTGVPGCGKSLTAKCVSAAWNMPLLRLDMGKIYQGLVGSSESNIRLALKTAEAISPCILWIDEIEKGLSGSTGGEGNGGTSTRVFGTLLTWMQEKTSPVFVFATANSITGLPPELLRKGRFDEIFFVDFPSQEERQKILDIHISKLKRDMSKFDTDYLARLCGEETFGPDVVLTGSEIEAWVGDALTEAFSRRVNGDENAELEMNDFETTIKRIVPMGQMRKAEFNSLRHWANQNAVSASATLVNRTSSKEKSTPEEEWMGGRRIDF